MAASKQLHAPSAITPAREPILERSEEVQAIVDLMRTDGVRFVTIVGPSGVGKTTVAEEVVRRLMAVDPVSAREIALHGLSSDGVAAVMAAAATIEGPASETGPAPSGRTRLLLIDGAEAVNGAAVAVADALDADPSLAVLVTSILPLELRGERLVRLAPLEVGCSTDPAVSPGTRFLFARYTAHGGRPSDDPVELAAAQELAAASGGLPLSLDLFAARAARSSMADVARDLQRRSALELLDTNVSASEVRHRSLRSTIAWTCDSLSANEVDLLGRLVALPGTVPIELISALCDVDTSLTALEYLLQRMHDCGLLRLERREDDDSWWVAVDSGVREYAISMLSDETRDHIAQRHAEYFRQLAHTAAPHAWSRGAYESRRILRRHTHDLVVAADHLRTAGRRVELAAMVADLHEFWFDTGTAAIARRLLDDVLHDDRDASFELPAELRARAAVCASELRLWVRRSDTTSDQLIAHLEAAAGWATTANDYGLEMAISEQMFQCLCLGDRSAEAFKIATAAQERALDRGDDWWYARMTMNRAVAANQNGDAALALDLGGEAFSLARKLDDDGLTLWTSLVLTGIPGATERRNTAAPILEDLLELAQRIGDIPAEGALRTAIAFRKAATGSVSTAVGHLRRNLEIARERDYYHLEGITLVVLTMITIMANRLQDAAKLHGGLTPMLDDVRRLQSPDQRMVYEAAIDGVRMRLGDTDFDHHLRQGSLLGWRRVLSAAEDLFDDLEAADALSAQAAVSPVAEVPHAGLTPRELDVLSLIAEGLSNKEIAAKLSLRPKTIMHHTMSIYRKLGVQSRTEAAAAAWRSGMLA